MDFRRLTLSDLEVLRCEATISNRPAPAVDVTAQMLAEKQKCGWEAVKLIKVAIKNRKQQIATMMMILGN